MSLLDLNSVLVVDDAAFDRMLLEKKLSSWGYRVYTAENGQSGLDIVKSRSPEFIITDLKMPVMDGMEFIRAVRRLDIHHTYIIVLSSSDGKASVVDALGAGADDYLTKPFHSDELHTRLQAGQRLLRLHSQDLLIFSMAKLADYRSKETGYHLERIQHFTEVLARQYMHDHGGINVQFITLLHTLSSLHDIGKVAIPDAILNKPGKLTEQEFERIKEHAQIGGKMLDEIYASTGSEQIRMARDLVLYHHERFDGTGYPEGLSGQNIPLSARIIALADVYDALTSARCYKPAFSFEKSESIIVSEKGYHFDPQVVECFENCRLKFREIADNLRDDRGDKAFSMAEV